MSMFSCYETKPINGVKITSLKRNRTIRGNLNLLDNKFENYDPETGIVHYESQKRKNTSLSNEYQKGSCQNSY